MENESKLRDAVFAINRAINQFQNTNETEYNNLVSARDQVWMIGVRLYNWKD